EDKPQSKALVMIDSENTELDNAKLKKIFEFCEAHGIPTDSMEIRHFDGTLAEAEIETKMAQVLEKFREEKAATLAEYNKKLAEEQTNGRVQALEDLQTLVNEKGEGILAELGFSAQDYILKDGKLQLLASGQAKFQDMVSGENPDNDLMVPADKVPSTQNDNLPDSSADNTELASNIATAAIPKSASAPTKAATAATASNTAKLERKKVEKEFEKFFEEGLAKTKNLSYFKTKTSLFGGWTEYIIYDKEDKDNRKFDEKGLPKPYNFKFFIKKDSDGNFHFAYRTPNRKKLDEATMGGIAGTLKGLGFTHVNFPKGIPDCDKGAWRKALAEQGIVPVGISIDRSKAEGMLKAAKDKLSSEEYAKYKYRLGLQLQENAIKKGKKLPDSEQQFIEGLLNSHKYEPFTDAYSNILKGKMTRILREKDEEFGAIKKIAAYRTLSSLFNAYNEAVKTNSNIPGINIRAENMNIQQIEQLYDALYEKQQKLVKTELYKELIDVRYKSSIGAKRADKIIINDLYKEARNKCNEINEDLSAMGVDEIGLIKSYDASLGYSDFVDRYLPEYKAAHPELKQTANASGKTQQPAVRKTGRDIN
ncbi:MAG: hypothetical protein ILA52_02105, partial [Alphaproteobacteria bacterium]|nr:hypothetical protein [Alphaproteobacteria bacterium]